jgi:acyl-CoA thioester hydrolase
MRQNKFQVRVNFGDTDKAGIVYYPNFFKWFDIAGHQFFRSIGLAPVKLQEEQEIIIPLLDAQCTFEKPLYYDDIITLITKVGEINNKTFRLRHEIFRDDVRICHGYELRGWVKREGDNMFAVPIPEDVKSMLSMDRVTVEYQNNPWLNA